MNILEQYRLELEKRVNTLTIDKRIQEKNHMMSKDIFEMKYKSEISVLVDEIGFDLESLDNYEKWLGGYIERD